MKITNTKNLKAAKDAYRQGIWYVDGRGDLYIGEADGVLKISCGNYYHGDEISEAIGQLMEVDVEIKIVEKK